MKALNIQRLVETRLKAGENTNWPVKFEGVPFKQPASGKWVAVTVSVGDSQQASIGGSPLVKTVGIVALQIFFPDREGTQAATTEAGRLGELFELTQLSDSEVVVDFRAVSGPQKRERTEGLQLNLNVPFQAKHFAR